MNDNVAADVLWLREAAAAWEAGGYLNNARRARAVAGNLEGLALDNIALREQVERMADRGTLAEVCRALGWQGGTIHQVLDEVRKLRGTVALRLGKVTRIIGEGRP